jgi:carboxyl-terminal processing protease
MKKRRLIIIIAVLLTINLVIGGRIYSKTDKDDFKDYELFSTTVKMIKKYYVDEDKVQTQKLIFGALKGMIQELDPYSQFMDPDIFKEMQIDTTGEFGGLGIEITKREGFVTVITPIEGTPAARAGVMPGDKIVKINNEVLREPDLNDVVKQLRGEPGSTVKITVIRGIKLKEFEIARDIIRVPSVVDAKILEDKIGYVRLVQFQESTADDLKAKIKELEDQGMESLVLDLRNNPGGLLKSAFDISEIFIPAGKTVVTTKGRSAFQTMKYVSQTSVEHKTFPLVILINKGSASASEIVAGAIKDLKRGFLVGEKSFGKGSVQTILPVQGHEDVALRLTTAKYYTPSGICIHDIGIEPHFSVILTLEEEEARLLEKYKPMEESLDNGKKIKPEGDTEEKEKGKEKSEKPEEGVKNIEEDADVLSLTLNGDKAAKPKYDRQLQKAVDVLQTYNFLVKQRDESEAVLKETAPETKTDTEKKIEPETKTEPKDKTEPDTEKDSGTEEKDNKE